jgi:hypothetical protein
VPGRVAPPGALATAPLVASLTPFDRYELGFRQRHQNAAPVVFALNPLGYTPSLVYALTPVSYWAGVAGGGSGLASVRTSFIFPVRASNTCRLGTILHLNCWAIAGPGGAPPK